MQKEIVGIEHMLPELEQTAVHFSSISQETLASAEEMLACSEDQVFQMESTHKIGLELTEVSSSLTKNAKRIQFN